ncbi:MAG: TGS domain-containing protein [Candidatus Bipolaricaulota bacterium]|nr:TGS domain-containing protein [Candidatus Bipolaricaulota bacterium]
MPANLTPEFIKARARFFKATTTEEKLAALEDMQSTIPKHKGTEKMRADIKRKIARLGDADIRAKKGHSSGHDNIPKEGAGQAVLVGPPNSGKSSLVAALTNAKPEVAEYPFSTLVPIPGMMKFEDVGIQLVDLPPLSDEYTEPWVYNLIRAADIVILVLSLDEIDLLDEYLGDLRRMLSERHLELATEAAVGEERVRILPTRIALTKADALPGAAELLAELPFPGVVTSVASGEGLDDFRRMIFDALHVLRVYTKLPGRKPDLAEPYTLPAGATVLDAVRTVHRDFADHLKYVRVWGSGRFDGQQVPSDYRLADGDIIEIHVG